MQKTLQESKWNQISFQEWSQERWEVCNLILCSLFQQRVGAFVYVYDDCVSCISFTTDFAKKYMHQI